MKIIIESNFVIQGLENAESVNLDGEEITIRAFFDKLSTMSPNHLEYIEAGSMTINPDDWEVKINGVPYENCQEGLDHILKDGDVVSLKIQPIGGG